MAVKCGKPALVHLATFFGPISVILSHLMPSLVVIGHLGALLLYEQSDTFALETSNVFGIFVNYALFKAVC